MKKLFKSLSSFPNMQEAMTTAAEFCGKDKSLPPLLAVLTDADFWDLYFKFYEEYNKV